MDGDGKKPRGGKKPARLAPAIDATQQQPAAARAVLETPALSDDNATAAQQVDDGQPVASVDESGGGGVAEEEEEDNPDDDEQVERFYALLANIRAMRGLVSTGTAAGRKRARDAEPPWRPAFRMEDFELEEVDSDSAGCAGEKRKKRERESSAKRLADDEEEGEVVEAKGHPRRGQPQSHKARRAGVLAVDT